MRHATASLTMRTAPLLLETQANTTAPSCVADATPTVTAAVASMQRLPLGPVCLQPRDIPHPLHVLSFACLAAELRSVFTPWVQDHRGDEWCPAGRSCGMVRSRPWRQMKG